MRREGRYAGVRTVLSGVNRLSLNGSEGLVSHGGLRRLGMEYDRWVDEREAR